MKKRRMNRTVRQAILPLLIVCVTTIWTVIYTHRTFDGKELELLEQRFFLPFITSPPPSNDEFSACALVMDDSHFLIEWLAYHYHVVNLRTLILVRDPRSQTSPSLVLDRWRELIHIEEWDDSDFMTPAEFQDAQVQVLGYFSDVQSNTQLMYHRARQRIFYYKCMQRLKDQDKTWLLLTDTDEFVSINYKTAAHWNISSTLTPPILWQPLSMNN
jgi:hypothetical protein